jgi:hypothetical protein
VYQEQKGAARVAVRGLPLVSDSGAGHPPSCLTSPRPFRRKEREAVTCTLHLALATSARRPRRLNALFLLVLAVAACSVRPTGQTKQGPTRWPPIVSHSALVCVAPAHPSAAGGCVVQDVATGISLRVTNAYADVTSTVVQLQTANTAAYPLDIGEPQLALPSGRTFQAAGGSSGEFSSIPLYEPVPAEDMGPLVHFVATAHFRVQLYSGMSPPPPTAPPAPPGSMIWTASR